MKLWVALLLTRINDAVWAYEHDDEYGCDSACEGESVDEYEAGLNRVDVYEYVICFFVFALIFESP